MKRGILSLILLICWGLSLTAQDPVKLYHPEANAMKEMNEAIASAREEGKHLLIQVGYNQCPWCVKLHQFMLDNNAIDSLLQADYVVMKVNFSKENRNPEAMQFLGFPQRFGFPVLVILDGNGNRIHTQNTAYLEQDQSYNPKEIISFLKAWNRKALDPDSYPLK